MSKLLAVIAVTFALLSPAPVPAAAQGGETYEQIISDPSLTREHATVIRLYRAVLDRQPDPEGLRYWLDAFDSGEWSTRRIAQFFATSKEFLSTYGETDNERFMSAVYSNVLDRQPDADGGSFWTAQLDAGMERGEMVLLISNAPEFINRHLLPADLAFASVQRGTLELVKVYEVDGERLEETSTLVFDLSLAQPIIHERHDAGPVAQRYSEREVARVAAQHAACETNPPDEGCHGPWDFVNRGASLHSPYEALTIGTFDQFAAGTAPGTLIRPGDEVDFFNDRRAAIEDYWPNADQRLLSAHLPRQLTDQSAADQWGPTRLVGFRQIFGDEGLARLLSSMEDEADLATIAIDPNGRWTVVESFLFTSTHGPDWTLVEQQLSLSATVDASLLEVPAETLSTEQFQSLIVMPCVAVRIDAGQTIYDCPPTP